MKHGSKSKRTDYDQAFEILTFVQEAFEILLPVFPIRGSCSYRHLLSDALQSLSSVTFHRRLKWDLGILRDALYNCSLSRPFRYQDSFAESVVLGIQISAFNGELNSSHSCNRQYETGVPKKPRHQARAGRLVIRQSMKAPRVV